jgi:uncharacterized protein YmfQ (DUF2313 family)
MPFDYPFPITELGGSSGVRTLKQLLPPGLLWNLEPDSVLYRVLSALSDEFDRVMTRSADLIEETDPRTATETLPDWEGMLGLPDSAIISIPTSDAARRLAITQKLVRGGGQTAAFYVTLAAACGYTVTIDDSFAGHVLRVGFRVGDRSYGTAWAYVWQVSVQPPTDTALSHSELEAIINRAKPAHTTVIFNYL